MLACVSPLQSSAVSHVMHVPAIQAMVIGDPHSAMHCKASSCLCPTSTTLTAMSVRRALAPRSVHLRIVPRPANLSESREIFRVLQRFGELSTFKYLRVSNYAFGAQTLRVVSHHREERFLSRNAV